MQLQEFCELRLRGVRLFLRQEGVDQSALAARARRLQRLCDAEFRFGARRVVGLQQTPTQAGVCFRTIFVARDRRAKRFDRRRRLSGALERVAQ